MAEITAALVKELREKTGAGMMDCKKALSENDGDLETATDWLRKKGLAAAAKKAGRVAAEGLVGVATDGKRGAVVEINAETDFVSRNEEFQAFVRTVAAVALENDGDLDRTSAAPFPDSGTTVAEALTQLVGRIGENLVLRRTAAISVPDGVVASYVHNAITPQLGRIGVLVGLESKGDTAVLDTLGKQLAMHICAARPEAITRDSLDPAVLDRERQVMTDQARQTGKPDNIIEKMVEGRLRKFYEEAILIDQVFVVDGETKVGAVIENTAKDLGTAVTLVDYARCQLGEGVEKKESDFAAEVAAQAGT